MKLSNLIENNAVAVGSNIIKKSIGSDKSGQMTARALDQVAQGGVVNRQFIDALQPYANILNKILSNPALRQRFEQMIKQLGDEIPAESVSEAMSDAYGVVNAEPEAEGSVTFRQSKNTDKGSVTVDASADDMEELAKIMKLAGLELPTMQASADDQEQDEPQSDESDKEVCDCCGNEVVDGECGCGPECPHCGGEPESDQVKVVAPSDSDASYSTDKEVLVNYIKDKLAKRLS